MRVGQEVAAVVQIAEETENGLDVIAQPGEVGVIADVFLETATFMVVFGDVAAQCSAEELTLIEAAPAAAEVSAPG